MGIAIKSQIFKKNSRRSERCEKVWKKKFVNYSLKTMTRTRRSASSLFAWSKSGNIDLQQAPIIVNS